MLAPTTSAVYDLDKQSPQIRIITEATTHMVSYAYTDEEGSCWAEERYFVARRDAESYQLKLEALGIGCDITSRED